VEWFVEQEVTMPRGETVTIRLAEMGSLVGYPLSFFSVPKSAKRIFL